MFLPFLSRSRRFADLSPPPVFPQQVGRLKAEPAFLTSPRLNPLACINISHLVRLSALARSAIASEGRLSVCYASYQQRRMNASSGKPALFFSLIFSSLVSLRPSLSSSLCLSLSDGLHQISAVTRRLTDTEALTAKLQSIS